MLSECFKINFGGYTCNSTRVDSVLNMNTVFTSVENIKIKYAYSVENSSWLPALHVASTLTTLAGDFS